MHFVAFLDVLGFKEMVENCTHDKLQRVYQNAFINNATYSLASGKIVPVETPDGSFVTPDLSNPLTSCLIVSDSVILWTQNASMQSFVNIVSAVGKILVSGFYTGLPMRGGIALGELSSMAHAAGPNGNVSIQTVFGKALTDAYKIESIQQWAGCAVSQACIDRYIQESEKHTDSVADLATIDYLESEKILLKYQVPTKSGNEEMWVVNWAKFNKDMPSQHTVRSAFEMHNKMVSDESTKKKVENTLAFLSHAGGV
jgi:hypothetical protein